MTAQRRLRVDHDDYASPTRQPRSAQGDHMSEPSASANVGTVRTAWNTTIMLAIAGALARYTKLDIDVEDPLVVAALGGALAVFYRASRAVADRWPQIGYVLFGNARPPAYPATPPAPAPAPDPP